MKKMTGKRMIPLIAALHALSMLITVFGHARSTECGPVAGSFQ